MMTYWIWPDSGTEWIARSAVRSARIPPDGKTNPNVNLRLTLDPPAPSPTNSSPPDFEGSIDPEADLPPLTPRLPDMSSDGASFDRFRSLREEISKASGEKTGISIDPSDLLGYSVAREKDGVMQRATVKKVEEDNNLVVIEYLTGQQDIIEYNDLINIINAHEEDGDQIWSFKSILDHRKKGSKWEVLVDWDHCNC